MSTSIWDKNGKKNCKRLEVDFKIPEDLEEQINAFLFNLNEEGGNLADCYEQEIRTTLNGCEYDLTEEQILILRNYYCRGGIYEDD